MSITISANDTSFTEPDQSDIVVIGTGDTITTNNSTIAQSGGSGSTLTVDGSGNFISAEGYGVEIGINGLGDTVYANSAAISLTDGSSATIIGSGNTITADGIGAISVFGAGEVINADNSSILIGGSLFSAGSATINGSNDTVNVSGAAVSINGSNDVVHANSAAISLTDGSSATVIGSGNTITADGIGEISVFGAWCG